jgi:hypothetical protein
LTNSTLTPLLVRVRHDTAQIVKVTGESVHRMHHDAVAVANEPDQLVELRPGDVLAGGFFGEQPIGVDAIELAIGVLVDAAHPDIADSHPNSSPFAKCVRLKSMTLDHECL